MMMTTDSIVPKDLARKGFYETPSGDVTFDGLGYNYSRELWQQYVSQGRRYWYTHSFMIDDEIVPEDGVPVEFGRKHAVCSICGEQRLVFRGIDCKELNRDGWCVSRGPWPTRLLRRLLGI